MIIVSHHESLLRFLLSLVLQVVSSEFKSSEKPLNNTCSISNQYFFLDQILHFRLLALIICLFRNDLTSHRRISLIILDYQVKELTLCLDCFNIDDKKNFVLWVNANYLLYDSFIKLNYIVLLGSNDYRFCLFLSLNFDMHSLGTLIQSIYTLDSLKT